MIGDILPLAAGVALSPLAILAVILMLTSKRAKSTSFSFMLGWVLGLIAVGGVALTLADTQELSSGLPALVALVIRFALAALLLFLAYRQWNKRPKTGSAPQVPKWMDAIDSIMPIRAFGFAVLLSAVKPKNLILTVAAALDIAQGTVNTVQGVIGLVVYVLIASSSIMAPVVLFLVLGDKAVWLLEGLKRWFVDNNATVMFVVLLVFSAVLIAEGVNGVL
ncbi:MAG: GAP family protein [Euryarchaeota archaeon]|nr:GAP family protein [Euryarchaeota archaeon]